MTRLIDVTSGRGPTSRGIWGAAEPDVRRPSQAGSPVNELAEQVGVPVVAAVFSDHVDVDEPQRVRLVIQDERVVERQGGDCGALIENDP